MKQIFLTLAIIALALTTQAQSIVAATYNIRQKNNGDIGNLWDDRKHIVTAQIKFHEFDIFGVQEAFAVQMNDMQADLSEYAYVGVGRDDGVEKGEYSAIFYKKDRFEPIKNGTFWLNEKDVTKPIKGWDAAIVRICTWAVFKDKENGKKFIFMNTHFDHVGTEARKESAKLILAKVKELAAGLPLILTGDFNVDEKNEAYFTLANSGFVKDSYDLAKIKFTPNSTFNSWGKNIKPTGRIDHIFISEPLKVKKYGILTDTYLGKYPSDHFPVVAELLW